MEITNENLIEHIEKSFKVFTKAGSRSDKKLHPLHGGIANDIMQVLTDLGMADDITVYAKGYGNNKEKKVHGVFKDKNIDITFCYKEKPIFCINVKSIQQNYKQNGGNYFENMIGEIVNLVLDKMPLFQVFILPNKIPYFMGNKKFRKWEYVNKHAMEQYINYSNLKNTFISPSVLVFNYNLNDMPSNPIDSDEYKSFYSDNIAITKCDERENDGWGDNCFFNDYSNFIKEAVKVITDTINKEKNK